MATAPTKPTNNLPPFVKKKAKLSPEAKARIIAKAKKIGLKHS